MANAEYVTVQGDRWDTIALKAYGDETAFNDIQDANPNVPITDVFKGGIKLIVPIKENVESSNLDSLPPWKRVQADLTISEQADAQSISDISITNLESFDKSFD